MTNALSTALYTSSSLYSRRKHVFAGLAVMATLGAAPHAWALPTGADVVSGQIAISQTDASHMIIHQGTDRAIINWQGFDILNGESTRFIQPSSSSIALNRVLSGNPTQILGELTANGRVMIVNGSGVFFGPNSQVNVAGMIASTADISNQNFNAGQYVFDTAGKADASIINKGTISAADSGLVALLAPGVQNDGVIAVKAGTVALGAGNTFAVDFYGDNLYSFSVGQPAAVKAKDENGNDMAAAIVNSGTVSAEGGTVYMTARAAKAVVDQAINTSGIVEATSAHVDGGVIVLDGGEGAVKVAGKVDASSTAAGGKGGKIQVVTDGGDISLASAAVAATGGAAGGTVNIGGDVYGGGSLVHAANVTVDAVSTVDVSALDNGDGGVASIWSDGTTEFGGQAFARGGANGGNGGLVETSGHILTINDTMMVNASAANGQGGQWLLDPINITIGAILAGATSLVLDTGTDVNINTTGIGAQAGNITVASNIDKLFGNNATLTLSAANDIIVNNGVRIRSTSNELNVVLGADRDGNGSGAILMNTGSSILSNGGDITLGGGLDPMTGAARGNATRKEGVRLNSATLNAGNGNISLNGTGFTSHGVQLNNSTLQTSGGNISIIGTGDGTAASGSGRGIAATGGSITTTDGDITLTGTAHGAGDYAEGIFTSGLTIESLGVGAGKTITLNGYGSAESTNANIRADGMWLTQLTQIKTVASDVILNGSAGGNSAAGFGIVISAGSKILPTGSANVTLNGAGNSNPSDSQSIATYAFSTVPATYISPVIGTATGTGTITFNGNAGNLSIKDTIIQTTNDVAFNADGNIVIQDGSIDADDIKIDPTNVTLTSETLTGHTISISATNNIVVSGGSMTTDGGDVTLGSDSDESDSGAISLSNSSITSNGGNVTLGGGVDPMTGSAHGNATAPVTPYGGQAGINIVNALVNAGSGNIVVNGIGGNNGQNAGVQLAQGGTLQTTSGDITVNGTAGNTASYGAYGVVLSDGGVITTVDGDIDITGTGASTCCGYGNGIQLYNSSAITSTGSGNIILTGTAGGSEANYNFGLFTVSGNNIIGGASSTGNITINVGTDAINLINATVQTQGDIIIDPSNLTLNATTMSGDDITIDPVADVTLLGSSITATGTLDINNSDVFYSDAASVLLGNVVNLNQSTGGSIQNAIDAISTASGSATLTLGNGTFNQIAKIVGHNNFTLTGSGSTIIAPTSLAGAPSIQNGPIWGAQFYAPILLAQDADAVTISNMTIDGGSVGGAFSSLIFNNAGGTASDLTITHGGTFGLFAVSTSAYSHTAHTVEVDNVDSSGASWSAMAAIGDLLTFNVTNSTLNGAGSEEAMDYSNGSQGTFTNNTVTTGNSAGIAFHGAHDVTISGGTITGTGTGLQTGISDDGLAYGVAGADNISINDVTITNVANGIKGNGGSDWSITDNHITGTDKFAGVGIGMTNVTGVNTITGNDIHDFATGISLNNTLATVSGNTIDGVGTGFVLNNLSGFTLSGNTIYARITGVDVNGSDHITLDGNHIWNTGDSTGINIVSSSFITANGNDIHGFNTGINVNGGNNVSLTGNTIEDADNGIVADESDDLQVTGNALSGVKQNGITVSDSEGLLVASNSVTALDKDTSRVGIKLVDVDGVSNSVDHNDVHDFDTGILLDDSVANVSANMVDGSRVGIALNDTAGLMVDANTIYAREIGIDLDDGSEIALSGNHIWNTGDSKGVNVDGSNLITISGNDIHGFTTGIEIDDSQHIDVANNDIEGSTTGILIEDSRYVEVDDNDLAYIHSIGVKVDESRDVDVTDNTIIASHNNHHGIGVLVSDSRNVDVGGFHDGNLINDFRTGVKVDDSRYVDVSHNRINDATTGVLVDNSQDVEVDDNNLTDVKDVGVKVVDSHDIEVTDNIMGASHHNHNGTGILVSDSHDVTVGGFFDGNRINDFRTGIKVDDSQHVDVAYNLIDDSTTGILVDESRYVEVDNNFLTDVKDIGIKVDDSRDVDVTDNIINASHHNHNGIGVLVSDSRNVDVGGFFDGNFINDFRTGVKVDDSRYIDVAHNRIDDATTGILVVDSHEIEVDDNNLNRVKNIGIKVDDSHDVDVTDNDITASYSNHTGTGILVVDSHDVLVGGFHDGNEVTGFHTGIDVDDSNDIRVSYNDLDYNHTGIDVGDSSDVTLHRNRISHSATGINVYDSNNIDITDNWLTHISGDGIVVSSGVEEASSHHIDISGNTIRGSNSNTTGTGITIVDTNYVTMDDNNIDHFGTGIDVDPSSFISITNNVLTNIFGDGIVVTDGSGILISYNNVTAADKDNSGTGIKLVNVSGSTDSENAYFNSVDHNTVTDFNTGISLNNSVAHVADNTINGSSTGFVIQNMTGFTLSGNTIYSRVTGVDVVNSSDILLSGNHIWNTGDSTGISIAGSSFVTADNNDIHGFNTGINVDNSNHITLSNNTIDDVNDVFDEEEEEITTLGIGINVTNSDSVDVIGNSIFAGESGASYGIRLIDVTNSNVGGNTESMPEFELLVEEEVAALGNDVHGFHTGIGVYGDTFEGEEETTEFTTHNINVWGNSVEGAYTGIDVHTADVIDIDNNSLFSPVYGIVANNVSNLSITNNFVDPGFLGIEVLNSDGSVVDGNTIEGFDIGILLVNSSNGSVTNNTIDGTEDSTYVGIALEDGSNGVLVDGNHIYASLESGIYVENSEDATITNNEIVVDGGNGIDVIGGSSHYIASNNLSYGIGEEEYDGRGNIGINLQGVTDSEVFDNDITSFNTGINGFNVADLLIDANRINHTLTGVNIDAEVIEEEEEGPVFETFALLSGGNIIISNNVIDDAEAFGIRVNNTNDVSILDNTLTNMFGNGIHVSNNNGLTVTGNDVLGNEGANVGIELANVSGDDNLVDDNTVTGFGAGIVLDGSFATVSNNILTNNQDGISLVNGSDGNLVSSNIISGSNIGINIDDSDGTQLVSNLIAGNTSNIGVLITDSDDTTFDGDMILSSLVGIKLDNAQDTLIHNVDLIGNGTALFAMNGSGGTLVGSTDIIGGTLGVLLDGEGTDMQFDDDNSHFTGVTGFFVLQNGAMFGEVLDASQQFFNGVRASNFTLAQYLDAQSRTIDLVDDSTLGLVFYRNFSGIDLALLNQLIQREDGGLNTALFSYAGHTVAGSPNNIPYDFRIQDVNLSLLAPSAGNTGGLGDLSPAAGGSDLGSLAPSAGGEAGNTDQNCVNSYLSNPLSNSCGATNI